MLGWCLYLLIAFIMGSVMSLCSSVLHGLLFIFSSPDTKCSSDIIFSFSLTRAILFLSFLFSENKGCIFFQNLLLLETFLGFILSKYALRSFLYK